MRIHHDGARIHGVTLIHATVNYLTDDKQECGDQNLIVQKHLRSHIRLVRNVQEERHDDRVINIQAVHGIVVLGNVIVE